jgi:hypothetical protein
VAQAAHSPAALPRRDRLAIAFMAYAWDDPTFNKIITKPDNVPIIILLSSVVFFTWLSLRRSVVNDDRIARGEPTLEGELAKTKVFVWPDLVYTEFICLILFTAFLILWSIVIQAPIEEPASQARTPNPSKAPWYFLGLQEMLVYFDPWIAGVLLPSFIIVGLCAIPTSTESEGERLLHVLGAPLRDLLLHGRVHPLVGVPGRDGHLPAGTQLGILRSIRVLGPPAPRLLAERQLLRDHLDQAPGMNRPVPAADP